MCLYFQCFLPKYCSGGRTGAGATPFRTAASGERRPVFMRPSHMPMRLPVLHDLVEHGAAAPLPRFAASQGAAIAGAVRAAVEKFLGGGGGGGGAAAPNGAGERRQFPGPAALSDRPSG